MDSAAWLAHFRRNRGRPTPPLPVRIDDLPADLRAPLIASLQRFQLGETGEGTIARQIADCAEPGVDAAIVECVTLWIREEGRHARELADVLAALGAAPIPRHFSQTVFKRARRAFGIRAKLATIFVAELVGLVFYRTVRERAHSEPLVALAATLHEDESAHLDFLIALLRRMIAARAGLARAGMSIELVLWTAAVLTGALGTLALDQGPTLAALGTGRTSFVVDCLRELEQRLARGSGPPQAVRTVTVPPILATAPA